MNAITANVTIKKKQETSSVKSRRSQARGILSTVGHILKKDWHSYKIN